MAPASVRFHPAAAQDAESAYDCYAARDVHVADAFREELQHAVDVVARNPLTGPVMGGGPDGTSSRASHSAVSTACATMRLKFSPLPMASDTQDTGGRVSERPSNSRIQRTAPRAAAHRWRSADSEDEHRLSGPGASPLWPVWADRSA